MLRTRKQNDKFHHYPSLSIMMKSWAFIVIVFFAITLFSFIFYKIINFFGYLLYYYDPLGFYSSAHSSPTFLSNIMYITIYTATNALLILIYAAITCLIHELYELNLNQLEIDFGRTENIRLLKETSIMLYIYIMDIALCIVSTNYLMVKGIDPFYWLIYQFVCPLIYYTLIIAIYYLIRKVINSYMNTELLLPI